MSGAFCMSGGINVANRSLRGEFLRYVSMNVLGMLGLSCYILADTWFVARGLGADGLAALNLAIPVYSFIYGSGMMIGMGGATRYTLLRGAGETEQAESIFTKSVLFACGLAALYMLLGAFGGDALASLLGAEGVVHPMTATYLRVILLFAPAFLLNCTLLCFVRNDGGPRLAMVAMVSGSLANIVLDYVFIFPCKMGIFGAVLATGFAPIISMAILSRWFLGRHNSFRLKRTGLGPRAAGKIAALGVSSLIAEVSSGVVMIVFNLLILNLEGSVGVAAYGVVANLSLVLMAIFNGIGQGIQPLVSRCCGAGELDRSRRVYRDALVTGEGIALLTYGLIFLLAGPIAGAFNGEGNAQLQAIASQGLRLYFLALPFAAYNAISALYHSAVDRPERAFFISILRGFVLILPLAFLMAWQWGMAGVWLAFPAAEGGTALLALLPGGRRRGREPKRER